MRIVRLQKSGASKRLASCYSSLFPTIVVGSCWIEIGEKDPKSMVETVNLQRRRGGGGVVGWRLVMAKGGRMMDTGFITCSGAKEENIF